MIYIYKVVDINKVKNTVFMCVVNNSSNKNRDPPIFGLEGSNSYDLSYIMVIVTNYELVKSMYYVSITLFYKLKKKAYLYL